MSHIAIIGGGGALAQPIIRHYLQHGHKVTAVCHVDTPNSDHEKLEVIRHVDMSTDSASVLTRIPVIDTMITLTGKMDNAKLTSMTSLQWADVIASNLTTVYQALSNGLPNMRSGGSVVVVGSIVGTLGGVGCANYAASKSGLSGLVKAAANEFVALGIRINLLSLGYVDSGMGKQLGLLKERIEQTIPMKRFATTQEVVDAVDFLARCTYMTGNTLTLAGGL